MKNHFQFACVILSNGNHETKIHTFIPCSPSGLTKDEKIEFLQNYHDVREEVSSDGLKDGFYWTNGDTAVCVSPINGENPDSNEIPVLKDTNKQTGTNSEVCPTINKQLALNNLAHLILLEYTMTDQVQTTGNTTKPITEEMAYQIAWSTFIPTPIPNGFYCQEDELRYEHYAEHVYEIFNGVSHRDIDGTIESLAQNILKAQSK